MTKLSDELSQLQHSGSLITDDLIKRVELLESFYDVVVKERDYERYKYDALKADHDTEIRFGGSYIKCSTELKRELMIWRGEMESINTKLMTRNYQLQDALRLLWYTRMPTGVKLEEVINDLGHHALWATVNELLNPVFKDAQ
jgi:hypothetical protein